MLIKRGWRFVPHAQLASPHKLLTHWTIVIRASLENMQPTLASPAAMTALLDVLFPLPEMEIAEIAHLEPLQPTKGPPCARSALLVVIPLKLRLSAVRIATWEERQRVTPHRSANYVLRASLPPLEPVVAQLV